MRLRPLKTANVGVRQRLAVSFGAFASPSLPLLLLMLCLLVEVLDWSGISKSLTSYVGLHQGTQHDTAAFSSYMSILS